MPAARLTPLVLLLAACGRGADESTPAAPGAPPGAPSFSREAFALASVDGGAAALPVPTITDPRALDEILAAAPRPALVNADGGPSRETLLGTDTGVASDAGAARPGAPDSSKAARIHVGKVTIEPGMSTPAIERAARAQLYWPLVQRCRDRDGNILPAEVVHLTFHLDRDGYVIPATILAVGKEPFADAARCMARELGMATFRSPAGARGTPVTVAMDVPSVD